MNHHRPLAAFVASLLRGGPKRVIVNLVQDLVWRSEGDPAASE